MKQLTGFCFAVVAMIIIGVGIICGDHVDGIMGYGIGILCGASAVVLYVDEEDK